MISFRWIDWNVDHIARHGVTVEEAEWVVRHPARGYPCKHRRGYAARGKTPGGRWLQVVFARDRRLSESLLFVYHARPLTAREARRMRQ